MPYCDSSRGTRKSPGVGALHIMRKLSDPLGQKLGCRTDVIHSMTHSRVLKHRRVTQVNSFRACYNYKK